MSYVALTDAQIAAGKPTAQELFDKVQDNFADHETRLSDLEASLESPRPITFVVKGDYATTAPDTGLAYERVWTNMTLTSGRVLVIDAGASGTLEAEVQYKRGGGRGRRFFPLGQASHLVPEISRCPVMGCSQ